MAALATWPFNSRKRMGARVLAVASGDDGVAFVRGLGADKVVDGKKDDIAAAARQFAPQGIDAVLLTAGGEAAEKALSTLRQGGRAAYPNGVEPIPKERAGSKNPKLQRRVRAAAVREAQPPHRSRPV